MFLQKSWRQFFKDYPSKLCSDASQSPKIGSPLSPINPSYNNPPTTEITIIYFFNLAAHSLLSSTGDGKKGTGFGFDSKNNDFIVIKVFLYYYKTTPWVEVYSLKTGKWTRIVGDLSSCISAPENIIGNRVFVNENVHWLICVNQYNNVILSFDCGTKTFKELILPECLGFLPYIQLSLLKGGNSLALVQMERSIFNIWEMKEYGNVNSWSMIFSFNSRCYGHIARVIAIRNSGELVLERRDNEVIFLDPKKDLVECSGLQVRSRDSFAGDLGESLFLINEKSSTSLIGNIVNKTESGIYLKKDS
ncbi:hypothetical protein K1719_035293 [Acacia pycnantha]|nr:hypothetical protein K1719_035293 [Acacia pycnantha]